MRPRRSTRVLRAAAAGMAALSRQECEDVRESGVDGPHRTPEAEGAVERHRERQLRPATEALAAPVVEGPTCAIPWPQRDSWWAARPVRVVATVAALVVMAATFTLLPVRPARAYLFYSTPCHYDHDQKDQIQMNFGGSPEKWLPDHPDFYSWYYYRAQEAANYWTLDSDVSIIRNDYSIAWTKMHIGVQTYSEDDGRYAFTRIWLGQCDGSKHWTRKPATAVRINATSGGMGADREKDRKNLAAAAFVHEFGHALGLDHVWDGCGSGWNYGIMQPTLASYTQCGWFRPQSDDINGIQALYDPSK